MFLSMNWIEDFVDLSGLDKVDLIHQFSFLLQRLRMIFSSKALI